MKQVQELVGTKKSYADTALVSGRRQAQTMRNIGILLLRLTTGGLLAGHGAQKLFGWFGGSGFKGTQGWVESMGLKPGNVWASGAATSEFGGGTLTALGLFHPLGPLATTAAMVMATTKVHWGKPIWVTTGGAELPVTNLAVALALALNGPGEYSLDRLFGIRVPRALVLLVALAEIAMVTLGIMSRPQQASTEGNEAGVASEEGQKAGVLS